MDCDAFVCSCLRTGTTLDVCQVHLTQATEVHVAYIDVVRHVTKIHTAILLQTEIELSLSTAQLAERDLRDGDIRPAEPLLLTPLPVVVA